MMALTVDEVKSRCEKVGLIYDFHYRKNGATYVKAFCKCGKSLDVHLSSITQKAKCNKLYCCVECGHKKTGEALKGRHLTEETKQKQSKALKGRIGKPHTEESRKKISEAHKGKTLTEETKQKISERMTGEKNPFYGKHHTEQTRQKMKNPNLTDEDRNKERNNDEGYHEWKQEVKKQANFTCDICGKRGGHLHAHHLDGYKWCKEKRTDITNGVCLCEKCHREFHSKKFYGKRNNTKEQYEEFKKIKGVKQAND